MTMIMETPILTTQHQTLPTLQARMVVEVYSDEELRSPQAFFVWCDWFSLPSLGNR